MGRNDIEHGSRDEDTLICWKLSSNYKVSFPFKNGTGLLCYNQNIVTLAFMIYRCSHLRLFHLLGNIGNSQKCWSIQYFLDIGKERRNGDLQAKYFVVTGHLQLGHLRLGHLRLGDLRN